MAAADAADKGKLYSISNTPKLSESNFCYGLEMEFTSPLGWIQQAGASETGAKSMVPSFIFL